MNVVPLHETLPFEYSIVEKRGETKRDGVLLRLEGTFQRADTKNANGRVYPRGLWDKIMSDDGVNERIGARRMVGELDHPASGSTALSRVSHVITEHTLLPDGRVKGNMEVLNTPAGQIAATLFEAGVQLGISSRGDGSVQKRGDTDEVQEDFRLETYDLVLKPSTPGAYPQIVESEEAAKQNAELIAQAVEGLVNSTSDIDVLLECHKIISVLEGCESRCESMLALLKGKLSNGGEPSRGKQEQQPNNKPSEVQEMKTPNVPAPTDVPAGINFSPEMAAFLQEWVTKGVTEAVAEKDEEIGSLQAQIARLSETRSELETKLDAATELIEEFTRKVKELSENATTDDVLQERYEASVRLLDEAVSRLQEMGEMQRRLAAAESLLAASIARHQQEAIDVVIDDVLADLDEATADKIRPLLAECATPEDVEARYETLSSLIESSIQDETVEREPLPRPRRQIDERDNRATQRSSGGGDFVTSRLTSRIHGGSI
jgi:hypothetical protein